MWLQHVYQIDEKTRARLPNGTPKLRVQPVVPSPKGTVSLTFSAATFIHAYALLGANPGRFNSDLSIYLSTAITFFDRVKTTKGFIELGTGGTQDWKKRIAEDLGASLSALFMVEMFDVTWETITQIPVNSALQKKRPDFEGFSARGSRYVFEAKGTTSLSSVEKALHKAIDQVKSYPEEAESRIAIVTFLSTDERLFPSHTFVVDPPAMPDNVPPSRGIATLLHGERLFEFAGMPLTAKAYVAALAKALRAEPGITRYQRNPELVRIFDAEIGRLTKRVISGAEYVGTTLKVNVEGPQIYFGVREDRLRELIRLPSEGVRGVAEQDNLIARSSDEASSYFSDGSCLIVDLKE